MLEGPSTQRKYWLADDTLFQVKVGLLMLVETLGPTNVAPSGVGSGVFVTVAVGVEVRVGVEVGVYEGVGVKVGVAVGGGTLVNDMVALQGP